MPLKSENLRVNRISSIQNIKFLLENSVYNLKIYPASGGGGGGGTAPPPPPRTQKSGYSTECIVFVFGIKLRNTLKKSEPNNFMKYD